MMSLPAVHLPTSLHPTHHCLPALPAAGVASLLAVYLRNRGLPAERLQCWAYETPACMDLSLAHACSGGECTPA